ncbi:MAG: hypothetical protein C5S49_05500 [Candidatus Methanogaster sp.]|nr:MAG: hypothetical protein C5S49_05500 [ANME-2 cluster archaeon]
MNCELNGKTVCVTDQDYAGLSRHLRPYHTGVVGYGMDQSDETACTANPCADDNI